MVATLRPAAERALRFVAFGGSLASEWDNPSATSTRAVLAELVAAGHEVTFLEQRGNPHVIAMLRGRGSAPFKAFTERYRGIHVRTYDLPSGWERTVWFGREIATADAVIALPGTPDALLSEIGGVASSYLARFIDESFAVDHPGYRLVRAGAVPGPRDLVLGPAVRLRPGAGERDGRPLAVIYDEATADFGQYAGYRVVVTASATIEGVEFVPEVELPELYQRHRAAVVVDASDSVWSKARQLLPLASGCELIDTAGQPVDLDLRPFDATRQAAGIVAATIAGAAR